ncbi:slipin family protein [Patescibacteria group bacterium]
MALLTALLSLGGLLLAAVLFFVIFVREIKQYERGVLFLMGRYRVTLGPGWKIIIPIFHQLHRVDIRVRAVDVPSQEAITKDNVSSHINAVIYYKVVDADKAVIEVANFPHAVAQLAMTTMRNVVGEFDLDQLLQDREQAGNRIREIVDTLTDPWGIKVENVELKDITLPEGMKRVIGKQAEAERERRAVVIKAMGEVEASENIAKAARMLSDSPGALHIRTLATLNDLGADKSNTVICALPLEVLRAFESVTKAARTED